MNDDSFPPMPQNETAVDYSRADPLVAVAAANDYVSGGVVVMRTADGGKSWKSTRVTPQFGGTRDFCRWRRPRGRAHSRRDHAFYLTQLCFFRAMLPFSEVQLFKSVDNGKTWTPGRWWRGWSQTSTTPTAPSMSRSSTTRSTSPSTTTPAAHTTAASM